MYKFIGMLFLFGSLMVLASDSFAERNCTRTVVTSDGTKTITVDCSSTFTKEKNPDIIRNPQDLNQLKDDFLQNTKDSLQNFKDKTADKAPSQDTSEQIATDSKEKEQAAIDAVRQKQQEQAEKQRK